MMKHHAYRLSRLYSGTPDVYFVPFPDLVIVCGIHEAERQYSLFFEVCFVYAGKALGYDGLDSQETRFHSRVLTAAAFPLVLFGHDYASATLVAVSSCGGGNRHAFTVAEHRIGLAVEGIHRTHKKVF